MSDKKVLIVNFFLCYIHPESLRHLLVRQHQQAIVILTNVIQERSKHLNMSHEVSQLQMYRTNCPLEAT